jgi:hypothetical protein
MLDKSSDPARQTAKGDRVALRFCTECGKEVSDRASACPHCGHPAEDAIVPVPSDPSVVVVKKNSHPVLTFIGVAAIVITALVVIAIIIAANHKEVKLVATDGSSDADCSKVFDYCINVYCTYKNVGNAVGEQRVRAQLLDTATGEVKADQYVDLTLLPQADQRLKFSFPEAEVDWKVSYVCKVDPKAASK